MQFIKIDLSLGVEDLDTLEKLREDAVYRLHQVRLEVVEICHCAHLRYAYTHRNRDRKCMWDCGKNVSEALSIKAIVVAAQVVVVFARVSQNPLNCLIVYEEVVRQVL